jgi:dTDP-glucose 4,6-dehydratase
VSKDTVLVTGAAGFIGSHLVDRLLSDGFRVIGVDNLSTGRLSNLRHLKEHPGFRFLERDVIQPLDDADIGSEKLAWVFHFASPASPPKYLSLPTDTLRVNAEGTYHLLKLAQYRQASFFLASTSECYGNPREHPQRETYYGNVNCIGPRAVYDEAKRYAEAMTASFQRDRGVDTRIIRIFNTYGPRMDVRDGRVITNFIRQCFNGEPITIYGDGRQTRSFQYIDDLVEGAVRLMAVDYNGPVNLGSPVETTILELAQTTAELVGVQSNLVFTTLPEDDPERRRPDIGLARSLIGWEPKITLREGLANTIDDLRARGSAH